MATTNYGVECPECGSTRNTVSDASLDSNGHRIRIRQCEGCEQPFTTVEVAFPFSYSGANALKPEYRDRKQPPRKTLDYFRVSFPESEQERPDRHARTVATVSLVKGRAYEKCRKGLHRLEGENVYVNKRTGARVCQPCRRESANARYRHMMDNMPQSIRDERNARNREYLRKRYAESKRSRKPVAA